MVSVTTASLLQRGYIYIKVAQGYVGDETAAPATLHGQSGMSRAIPTCLSSIRMAMGHSISHFTTINREQPAMWKLFMDADGHGPIRPPSRSSVSRWLTGITLSSAT